MVSTEVASDAQLLAESLGPLPEPVVRPALVVVSGLPGTGKSLVSRKLAERLPLLVLESDVLRKALFPAPSYNSQESARLFRAIHHLIEALLRRGISLVLDATNLAEAYRERLYNISDRLGARLIIVRVDAPPELVQQRLKERSQARQSENHSEADWTVYQKLQPTVQRIQRNHYSIDTSKDIEPVLGKIIREINR